MIELTPLELSGSYVKRDIENCNVIIQGIYFIFNEKDKLMYIGKSNDIFKRMKDHYRGIGGEEGVCHNYHSFQYGILNDPVDRDIYETWYINKMKPPINTRKLFSYESKKEEYSRVQKTIGVEDGIKEVVFKMIDECLLLA